MSFKLDFSALLLTTAFAFALALFYRWGRGFLPPLIRFSNITALKRSPGGWRERQTALPNKLGWAALFFFLVAFTDPHFFIEKKGAPSPPPSESPIPTEGIAIYLVLDQSGSMKEEVRGMSPRGYMTLLSKVDLLKNVTTEFVRGNRSMNLSGRQNDLIGVVSFARTAQVMSPLTLDHQAVLDEIAKFDVVKDREWDGTAIGYAIYKTANLIAATRHFAQDLIEKGKPAYDIKSSVIILVTDGFQDPNPLDAGNSLRNMSPMEAAKYAKEQGIHLYIINGEPSMATEEFAPHRHLMERAATLTGGKFFLAGGGQNLSQIYSEIDTLEKSQLPETFIIQPKKEEQPHLYQRISLYPWLIALGMISLLLSIVLSTTLLKRFP